MANVLARARTHVEERPGAMALDQGRGSLRPSWQWITFMRNTGRNGSR